eukprot:9934233-Alexandrium_andersonii.AAC.1
MDFYAKHKQSGGAELTQVADLTVNMLGSTDSRVLKTKGAETWGVLLFIQAQLREKEAVLGAEGKTLREAGACP